MRPEGKGGFFMLEVLLVVVLAGLVLGGIVQLVEGVVRAGEEGDMRFKARWAALGALDRGAAGPPQGTLRVETGSEGGRRKANAIWPGGTLTLEVWTGHE